MDTTKLINRRTMQANEDLWDEISRVPVTRKPELPQRLSDKLNELRKQQDITLESVSKKSGVDSTDMLRNILYHNLRKVNHDVIKLCNYFKVNITDYLED